MPTTLSLKQRSALILMALTLALAGWALLSRPAAARVARGAAQPVAVAVNWNSYAIIIPPTEG